MKQATGKCFVSSYQDPGNFAHPAKGAWVDSNLSLNPSSLLMIMDRSFFDAAEIPM